MSELSPQQCLHQLNTLLQRQVDKIMDLNSYLSDLKSAIAGDDSKQLNDLLSQQRLPTAEIEDLENQRSRLLKIYGYDADKDSLLACIEWCDQHGALEETYKKFEKALQQLQHSVQLNHLLVNKCQKRIRQSLYLLTNQMTSDKPSTYSATGVTENPGSRRSLAQA
jgi:flagellar biosynthesis/type III secretory pathway chaperone